MKNTKKCPKCSSNDIIIIPGKVGAYGTGNNIPMGLIILNYVKVTRYLCLNCGFSEEWIDANKDIEKLRKKYQKLE